MVQTRKEGLMERIQIWRRNEIERSEKVLRRQNVRKKNGKEYGERRRDLMS